MKVKKAVSGGGPISSNKAPKQVATCTAISHQRPACVYRRRRHRLQVLAPHRHGGPETVAAETLCSSARSARSALRACSGHSMHVPPRASSGRGAPACQGLCTRQWRFGLQSETAIGGQNASMVSPRSMPDASLQLAQGRLKSVASSRPPCIGGRMTTVVRPRRMPVPGPVVGPTDTVGGGPAPTGSADRCPTATAAGGARHPSDLHGLSRAAAKPKPQCRSRDT